MCGKKFEHSEHKPGPKPKWCGGRCRKQAHFRHQVDLAVVDRQRRGELDGAMYCLDLWMASGREPGTFEAFTAEHGAALVWSLLLDEVRGVRPPCLEPLGNDDFCVFAAGHIGPHWGADDVATPVFLPPKAER
jgi:hypothetical protein